MNAGAHALPSTDIMLQAIHDMRSPLSALGLLIPTLKEVAPSTRSILETAVQRLMGISASLNPTPQNSFDQQAEFKTNKDRTKEVQTLSKWLEEICDEKRIEHAINRIEFHFFPMQSGKIRNEIQSLDFKRVISNLLNNAAEASTAGAAVALYVTVIHQKLCIRIDDEGTGFDENVLKNLGVLGNTTKPTGMGRGLYHAIQVIEREWNGDLYIDTTPNHGTTLRILLDLDLSN